MYITTYVLLFVAGTLLVVISNLKEPMEIGGHRLPSLRKRGRVKVEILGWMLLILAGLIVVVEIYFSLILPEISARNY